MLGSQFESVFLGYSSFTKSTYTSTFHHDFYIKSYKWSEAITQVFGYSYQCSCLLEACLLKAVKAELHSLNSSNKNKSVYSPVDLPSLKHQTLPTRKETFGYKQLTFFGGKVIRTQAEKKVAGPFSPREMKGQ